MTKIALENVTNIIFNPKNNDSGLKTSITKKPEGLSFNQVMERSLNDLERTWKVTTAKANNLVPALPKEYQTLFELQKSVYQTHFQTEIVTKVGDSVQSTLKKLQSQGG